MPKRPRINCPEYHSSKIWKDGIRYTRNGEVQRYICRSCGFRFSKSSANRQVKLDIAGQFLEEPNSGENLSKSNIPPINLSFEPSPENFPFQGSEDIGSHRPSRVTVTEKHLNNFCNSKYERRVCVSSADAKNLAKAETRQKRAAGATSKSSEAEIKGKLIEYAWWMKKQGYSPLTIKSRMRKLKRLVNLDANLLNPESVKEVIAKQSWKTSTKANVSNIYGCFCKLNGLKWNSPIYKPNYEMPFIPIEGEIDQLIAAAERSLLRFCN